MTIIKMNRLTDKHEKDAHEAGYVLLPKSVVTIIKYNGHKFPFELKVLYSYLVHWSHTHKDVYPSLRLMGKDLGIASRTTIIKYLNWLENLGLLKIVRRRGRSSLYLVQPIDEKKVKRAKTGQVIENDLSSGAETSIDSDLLKMAFGD